MNISFTKEQFEALMKAVYLGNWMANAHRTEDFVEEYQEIHDYIFSYAKEFGLEKYVDDEKVGNGKVYPTRYFEEETDVHELHDEYDNETFWDELIDRMARKELIEDYGEKELEKMDRKKMVGMLYEYIDTWADEVDAHGLDRLGIVEKK